MTDLREAVARALAAKRADLQASPLARIYPDLADAALSAIAEAGYVVVKPPDYAAIMESEKAWIAETLSFAIANLGYAVGMGLPPSDGHVERMSTVLAERTVDAVRASQTEGGK